MKMLINNKKAYFNFEILDKIESGIVLEGWEVKSVKIGKFDISGAYIKNIDNSLFLVNSRIPVWKSSLVKNTALEYKDRKLLLKKSEIKNLVAKSKESGNTIVPLEVYENDKSLVKVLIAVVRGRKKYDKRQKLKERDMKKRIDSERKGYNI